LERASYVSVNVTVDAKTASIIIADIQRRAGLDVLVFNLAD
jgi:hypothetical protein